MSTVFLTDDFAFALRLNVDLLASDGSKAMVALSAAVLAIADTGMPISNHAAGTLAHCSSIVSCLIKVCSRFSLQVDSGKPSVHVFGNACLFDAKCCYWCQNAESVLFALCCALCSALVAWMTTFQGKILAVWTQMFGVCEQRLHALFAATAT